MSLLHRIQFAKTVRQVRDVPTWSPSRILHAQRRRLERLLTHTLSKSPYYRAKFGEVDIKKFRLDQLPPTTKDEMRENFDSLVTDKRLHRTDLEQYVSDDRNLGKWYLDEYAVCQTSGSQGAPLQIVQNRSSLNVIFALMSARSSPDGAPNLWEGIRRLIRPKHVVAMLFRRGVYPSSMTVDFMPHIVAPFARLTRLSSMQADLIDRLNELQPDVLTGYASVLEALALQPNRLKLKNLEYITNCSEQLSSRAKARIEEGFGVPVFDHYGTGECLQLADACRGCGGVHINSDWAILETVDDNNQPVPAGTSGAKILVTNLANYVQPFIRYEIGDRVALSAQTCSTANNLPRIERFEGRSAELFWVREGSNDRFLTYVLFHSSADSLGEIREWRAIQTERNRVEFHIQLIHEQPNSAAEDEIKRRLLVRLAEYGMPSCVVVNVTIVDAITSDERTGKMRRMISEIGPPNLA